MVLEAAEQSAGAALVHIVEDVFCADLFQAASLCVVANPDARVVRSRWTFDRVLESRGVTFQDCTLTAARRGLPPAFSPVLAARRAGR